MPHLSGDDLLEELRSLAWRLRRIPTTSDMQRLGRYSAETYLTRFGGWTAALDVADLADRQEPYLSRPRLLRHLREVGDEQGRTPTRADLQEAGNLSPWVYVDTFNSWHAALKQAGFDIVPRTTPAEATVTHEVLRTTLVRLADEIGRTPSKTRPTNRIYLPTPGTPPCRPHPRKRPYCRSRRRNHRCRGSAPARSIRRTTAERHHLRQNRNREILSIEARDRSSSGDCSE